MASGMTANLNMLRKGLDAVRADPVLSRYPIVAMGSALVLTLFMLILIAGLRVFITVSDGTPLTFGQVLGILLILVLFYVLTRILATLNNAALIGGALMRMSGESPTVRDGYQLMLRRIVPLLGYAGLSATLGVFAGVALRGEAKKDPENLGFQIMAAIVGTSLAAVWSLMGLMAVPVILVDNPGLFAGMRRSAELFQAHWGDRSGKQGGLGWLLAAIALLFAVPGCLLAVIARSAHSSLLTILGFMALFLLVSFFVLMAGAASALFQASLYLYAAENEAGPFFTKIELDESFRP